MASVLYEAVFALLTRTLVRGYRRAVTLITLVAGFASTVFLPLATIVAAAALLGPTQVGARLLLLALEGRLSLRRSGLLAVRSPVPGTAVLPEIGPGAPLFPVLYGAGNGMLTIARHRTGRVREPQLVRGDRRCHRLAGARRHGASAGCCGPSPELARWLRRRADGVGGSGRCEPRGFPVGHLTPTSRTIDRGERL